MTSASSESNCLLCRNDPSGRVRPYDVAGPNGNPDEGARTPVEASPVPTNCHLSPATLENDGKERRGNDSIGRRELVHERHLGLPRRQKQLAACSLCQA